MRRRDALRLAAALPLLPPSLVAAAWGEAGLHRERRPLMGTWVSLVAPGRADELQPAFDAAWRAMGLLEALCSRYAPQGVLERLAQCAGRRPLAVPAPLSRLLREAKALSARSEGRFDVTVGAYRDWHFETPDPSRTPPTPQQLRAQSRCVDWRAIELDGDEVLLQRAGMRLDLGGFAKLPVLEAGLQALRHAGLRHALIDGGGDVRAIGNSQGQPQGRAWRVGLRDPLQPSRLLGQVALHDGWVVSSGDYERAFVHQGRRYHHILDPHSGLPTQGLRGVSLLGQDVQALNGLGTLLMVRGQRADAASLPPGVQGVGLRADGSRWQSAGLALRPLSAA